MNKNSSLYICILNYVQFLDVYGTIGRYLYSRPTTRILTYSAHQFASRADDVVRVPEVPGANKTQKRRKYKEAGVYTPEV